MARHFTDLVCNCQPFFIPCSRGVHPEYPSVGPSSKRFHGPRGPPLTVPNGSQSSGGRASTATGLALAGSHDSLENLALDAGESEQAQAIVRTMITRDPSVAMWCCCAGLILARAGKFTQAEQALREAIEIGPKNFDYSYALAILYLESGQLEKSLDQTRRLERLVPGLPVTKQLMQDIQQRLRATRTSPKDN